MYNYFLIPAKTAQQIGKFEYEKNKVFDPFVNEQESGDFIITRESLQMLVDLKKITPEDQKTVVGIAIKNIIPKPDNFIK